MRTTPIKRRILNVLVQYKDRPFLTIPEITQLAYGVAYIRDTKSGLEKLVRRNIYSVMDLAMDNKMIVLPVKRRNEETGEIEKKTLGYKIAGKEDAEYIDMFLEDKDKRAKSFILAYNSAIKELDKRKLLPQTNYTLKLIQQ